MIGMIGMKDMRSNRCMRCVRLMKNRDDIKINRNRDKKNKYIEIKNIL
jgi:hypothetical protein